MVEVKQFSTASSHPCVRSHKHSMRKLMGYRNWRQWWCKKEGNKVFGKEKPVFSRCNRTKKYNTALFYFSQKIKIKNFLSPKPCFRFFLNYLCLQSLYPTKVLIEAFSLENGIHLLYLSSGLITWAIIHCLISLCRCTHMNWKRVLITSLTLHKTSLSSEGRDHVTLMTQRGRSWDYSR